MVDISSFRPAEVHEQRFSVAFDYPVVFCREALRADDPTLAWAIARREPARRHPLFVVLDAGLARARPSLAEAVERYAAAHADRLELRAPAHELPGGEACKNDPAVVFDLLRAFAEHKLDRQASVVVIGGGAVLDAAGYAAATAHRGLRVVRMPSTVLSQNDGGVGVKNGVNAFAAKNFLGTFAPPHAVLNDADLLVTLPLRDVRAGLAEAVKVALIRDASLFEWLERNAAALGAGERDAVEVSIRRSADLHLSHIRSAGDPFELGSARPLDYGHWAAHKLELLSGHELRHGEAVAIGMLLDARYAERAGVLRSSDLERIFGLIQALGLPLYHPALAARVGGGLAVLAGLAEFREHLGGALSVTLLSAVGRSHEVSSMDPVLVESSIEWLAERQRAACA